mmetsp:Transcript_6296/g.9181  ORF Transcript_6296/g.9181 Transcript_6296/m.9181 type:complete len:362 (+) Transcript_6296:125-1210(+)|eukprot:CAMPEP_0196805740 /NCGR_PEP_ID=MMETSP1362-20130617/5554_1 /TAXON_ID=163516 /ORGANISM="Leptocylindrus danicus, Strain CCMP1856" /LENGTH=361 /DNA_ID=CAMNT_0042178847 /DNA_START=125 /DNA_END=1210 /DNA_ORIENTATION=-
MSYNYKEMNESYARLAKKLDVVFASTGTRGARSGQRGNDDHGHRAAAVADDRSDAPSELTPPVSNVSPRPECRLEKNVNAYELLGSQKKQDRRAQGELLDMFQSGGTFQGDSFDSLASTSSRRQRNFMQSNTSMSSLSSSRYRRQQRVLTQHDLEQVGCEHLQESRYEDAFECYENALDLARQNCLEGHEEVAKFNFLLARIAMNLKRWHQCYDHCVEAMEVIEALFGTEHYIYVGARKMGDKASEKIYEESPKAASNTHELNDLLQLADSAMEEKNYKLAARHLEDAKREAEFWNGKSSIEMACVEAALGDNDKLQEKFSDAREHYKRAMSLARLNGVAEDEPMYADLFRNMMSIAGLVG